LSTLLRRLKCWRKEAEAPLDSKERYWNGLCPLCGEHIGIDILKNVVTKRISAICPCCRQDIYTQIKETLI